MTEHPDQRGRRSGPPPRDPGRSQPPSPPGQGPRPSHGYPASRPQPPRSSAQPPRPPRDRAAGAGAAQGRGSGPTAGRNEPFPAGAIPRPDQARPDQARPDQSRPDQARTASPAGGYQPTRIESRGAVGDWAPPQKPEPIEPGERGRARPDAGPRSRSRGGSASGSDNSSGYGKRSAGRRPAAPVDAPPAAPARRRRRRRFRLRFPIFRTLLTLILLLAIGAGAAVFYFDGKLKHVDALGFSGAIADTPGTNWLVVGSDTRADLTQEQKDRLTTGDDSGSQRTDTIILMHIPEGGGKAQMISIPRDLYVDIPDNGAHKINAAYAFGGPQLLAQTIEVNSGVHLDHYIEIGFAGFDSMVNSLGGIEMCLDYPIDDPMAGINLPAGCQKLNGQQALGFVRSRATPNADLDRVVNQRKFLTAVMSKATGLGSVLNPFRAWSMASGTAKTLTVDDGDHLWDLARLAWAMRSAESVTLPTGGSIYTDDGDSLEWNQQTSDFFAAIAAGTAPAPPE